MTSSISTLNPVFMFLILLYDVTTREPHFSENFPLLSASPMEKAWLQ